MMWRGSKILLWCASLGVGSSIPAASFDLVIDFAKPGGLDQTFEASGDDWSVAGLAHYDPTTQDLVVQGTYRSRQAIEPTAPLSYRILDESGGVLEADGVRYAWEQDPAGGLRAPFVLDMPQVSEDPLRTGWTVEFNAVKEGEFWYRDRFPEIEFPAVTLRNLPPRDHFRAFATWVPRYLPAGFSTRIPAWYSVGGDADSATVFRPSADLTWEDFETKVRSARLEMEGNTFRGWMPIGPQDERALTVRPGMVWEGVRWYEASDWFEREIVTFVPPHYYLLGMAFFGALGLGGCCARRRLRAGVVRFASTAGLALFTLWWIGHLLMSGFGPAMLVVYLAWMVGRSPGLSERSLGYAFGWLFMMWIEVYWGQVEGSAGIRGAALLFSGATWAVLLAPLLLINSRARGLGVGVFITGLWWLATVVAVVYNEFFFDFPSVGDLAYAGQIGQLGDSVGSLLSPRHWLPLWVWGLMVGASVLGLKFSGTPRSKKQNT